MLSRAVFRVDAAPNIGLGHLVRCLRLARELKRRDVHCEFIRRGPVDTLTEGFATSWIGRERLGLRHGDNEQRQSEQCHKNLVAQVDDADSFLRQLGRHPKETTAVIVDHYCLDEVWEGRVAHAAATLVVIDDLANRVHQCDILIDSAPLPASRYANLVPATSLLLTGPKFALLDQVRNLLPRESAINQASQLPRVLATFGGGNIEAPVKLLLAAIDHLVLPGFALDVVLPASVTRELRRALAAAGAAVHGWRSDLPQMIAAAQLVVSAGGSTVFECVRAGTPAITIATAHNQLGFAQAWNDLGLTRHLGGLDSVSPEDLRQAILEALNDSAWRTSVRIRAGEVVDGRGTERVASHMCGLSKQDPLG